VEESELKNSRMRTAECRARADVERSAGLDVYGFSLRWVDSPGATSVEDRSIALVRESEAFPDHRVTWVTRGRAQQPWIPSFGLLEGNFAYRFEGVGDFVIARDGSSVRVFPEAHASQVSVEFILLRGIIPRLLHVRGVTCLHASAVGVHDGVVGFVGPSGAGKSTVAAALVERGFPLVTDDVLPLHMDTHAAAVLAGPGLSELRLYRQAAVSAGVTSHLLPPAPDELKWRFTPSPDRIVQGGARLSLLYLLHSDSEIDPPDAVPAAPLSSTEALLTLIGNSFWLVPDETRALAHDLACLSRVVNTVPVRRLRVTPTAEGLAAVESLVRTDCRAR
jgi:hypothetical protein